MSPPSSVVAERVHRILRETFAREVDDAMSLRDDLQFDSLDFVELAVSIEVELEIEVEVEEVEELATVGDVVALAERKLEERA